MSFADLVDAFNARNFAADPRTADSSVHPERRKRRRTAVRWPLVLWKPDTAGVFEAVTQNLSSSGFYCLLPFALTPGESVRCALRVPAYDPNDDQRHVLIDCTASVVRAEAAADGAFGVACRINEYRLSGGLSGAK